MWAAWHKTLLAGWRCQVLLHSGPSDWTCMVILLTGHLNCPGVRWQPEQEVGIFRKISFYLFYVRPSWTGEMLGCVLGLPAKTRNGTTGWLKMSFFLPGRDVRQTGRSIDDTVESSGGNERKSWPVWGDCFHRAAPSVTDCFYNQSFSQWTKHFSFQNLCSNMDTSAIAVLVLIIFVKFHN